MADSSAKAEFIGEPIEITFERPPWQPASFTWRGQEYPVARVLDVWFDYGWGPLQRRPKRWWQRRHRTYYRVQTDAGEIYEMYHDRARREWTLYRRLERGEADQGTAPQP